MKNPDTQSEPLFDSVEHPTGGRIIHVVTYSDGKTPLKATMIFRRAEEAKECARVLREAMKPR